MATDYGTDVSTFAGFGCDLDPTFALITGPRVVAEQVARGLVDLLQGALNASMDDTAVRVIRAAVENLAVEDERVSSASAEVAFTFATKTLTCALRLGLIEGETFSLVLNISAVSVDMIIPGEA